MSRGMRWICILNLLADIKDQAIIYRDIDFFFKFNKIIKSENDDEEIPSESLEFPLIATISRNRF